MKNYADHVEKFGSLGARYCPDCGVRVEAHHVGHFCVAKPQQPKRLEPRYGSGGAPLALREDIDITTRARVLAIDYVRERVLLKTAEGLYVELDRERGAPFL